MVCRDRDLTRSRRGGGARRTLDHLGFIRFSQAVGAQPGDAQCGGHLSQNARSFLEASLLVTGQDTGNLTVAIQRRVSRLAAAVAKGAAAKA